MSNAVPYAEVVQESDKLVKHLSSRSLENKQTVRDVEDDGWLPGEQEAHQRARESIAQLELILKVPPPSAAFSSFDASQPALHEGFCMVRRVSGGSWKRRYIKYSNGFLAVLKDPAVVSKSSTFAVSYCVRDTSTDPPRESSRNKQSDPELDAITNMSFQRGFLYFRIYAPNDVLLVQTFAAQECFHWVKTIKTDLDSLHRKRQAPEHAAEAQRLWADKVKAEKSSEPLMREVFQLELRRYNTLMTRLATGEDLQQPDNPLSPSRKTMSGMMRLQVAVDGAANSWNDYYFVLVGTTLLYFVDSRSPVPVGLISLKYATVGADERQLKKGKSVWRIRTPLRSCLLQAKHEQALAEWLYHVNAIMAPDNQPRYPAADFVRIVKKLQTDASTTIKLLQFPNGYDLLMQFIQNRQHRHHLLLWKEVENYHHCPKEQRKEVAQNIIHNLIERKHESTAEMEGLPVQTPQVVEDSSGNVDSSMFDKMQNESIDFINKLYHADFLRSKYYSQLLVGKNKLVAQDPGAAAAAAAASAVSAAASPRPSPAPAPAAVAGAQSGAGGRSPAPSSSDSPNRNARSSPEQSPARPNSSPFKIPAVPPGVAAALAAAQKPRSGPDPSPAPVSASAAHPLSAASVAAAAMAAREQADQVPAESTEEDGGGDSDPDAQEDYDTLAGPGDTADAEEQEAGAGEGGADPLDNSTVAHEPAPLAAAIPIPAPASASAAAPAASAAPGAVRSQSDALRPLRPEHSSSSELEAPYASGYSMSGGGSGSPAASAAELPQPARVQSLNIEPSPPQKVERQQRSVTPQATPALAPSPAPAPVQPAAPARVESKSPVPSASVQSLPSPSASQSQVRLVGVGQPPSELASNQRPARADEKSAPRGVFKHSCVKFILKSKGSKKTRVYRLPHVTGALSVGRDSGSDVVVSDSGVSHQHARIEWSENGCEFSDLGSTFGSQLNGVPVFKAFLKIGDVLSIGKSTLELRDIDYPVGDADVPASSCCVVL